MPILSLLKPLEEVLKRKDYIHDIWQAYLAYCCKYHNVDYLSLTPGYGKSFVEAMLLYLYSVAQWPQDAEATNLSLIIVKDA